MVTGAETATSTTTPTAAATCTEEVPGLLPHHLEHLRKSAISLDIIRQRGYESVLSRKRLEELGFGKTQGGAPGILIPLHGVGGGIVGYQFRPDSPRLNSKGKAVKYETPESANNRLDCPPACRKYLGDPAIPLLLTEGVKKDDSIASQGECAIAITGVWNWRSRNSAGGLTVSADFDSIAFNGRQVFLIPDSDYSTNPNVARAMKRLAAFLKTRKAVVSMVPLPPGDNGAKNGVDDFLAQGHTIAELKALAVPAEEAVEPDEEKELERSFFYSDNQLYLEVRKYDGDYGFACLDDQGKVRLVPDFSFAGKMVKPRPLPRIEDTVIGIVGLPDEGITSIILPSPDELYDSIKGHIKTYVDLPELDVELCVYYILFTWFYAKVKTLGYLRFLADTGKGKSRTQKVVGDLCFYPVYASGASSFSGLARLNNRWRGTLIMDEADTSGDKEHQFVKYLNLGFERGKYYVMSDKQNPKLQEFFDPFSPKILAMRQPFRDNATEARLLSVSPHETTNPNIPIILPEEYYVRMQQLRNSLALFTLHHFNEVQGNHMVSFDSLDVEPRLRQLAMPLSIVCQLWPEGARLFREYLSRRQDEVRKVRSLSWEGSLVNLICGIAAGDTELDPEFAGYYDSITGQIQAVTPTMVARMVKSSPKMVTQTLASVGFEVEWRWIDVDRGGQKAKKRTRAYCIPDARTWAEVISRYYHAENAETPWEAPDVLKSHRFVRVPGAVLSVPCVTSSPGNSGHKTVGTLGTRYSTRQEDDDDEPDYPCSVCGAESWRHGNDGWMCTGCRASPEGEVLSSANLSGGDPL